MTDDALTDLTYTVQDPVPTGGSTVNATEQTFPTMNGVLSAYAAWEREMFAHPDDAERYAEVLSLTRQQLRDMRLGNRVDEQMIGHGNRVTPLDPDEVSRLITAGVAVQMPTPKTARQEAEDDLVRAGLAPILAGLPIPQLDAVRHVHWFQHSLREAGAALAIDKRAVTFRLERAYAYIKASIPVDGYRRVRQWLVAQGQKDRAAKEVNAA
jgi:hypothetical protein